VLDYIAEVNRRMVQVPTTAWTQNRWQDWAYIIHWALEQDPQEQEQMLWDAAVLTQQQSWDWDAYYNQLGAGTFLSFLLVSAGLWIEVVWSRSVAAIPDLCFLACWHDITHQRKHCRTT
jgi:hypothetical protein